MKYFLISLCGLVGVMARYGINTLVGVRPWPVGTFIINLLGCFFIGVVHVLSAEKGMISDQWRLALMVGLLGGFTTFSSFVLETLLLLNKETSSGWAYLGLSVVLGMGLAQMGMQATRWILS